MPLPLIPAIFIGTSVAAGLKGAFDMATSAQQIAREQHRYKQRRAHYEIAEQAYLRARNDTERCLYDLGLVRLRVMETLGKVVVFLQKARMTSTPALDHLNIAHEELAQWQGYALEATDILRGLVGSIGTGAATAVGTYGLIGAFGAASTGTAIASLSGAAATNATLAWLGGGALAAGGGGMALGTMVLGGIVAGPAVLVGGFFIATQAETVKTEVRRKIAEMDIAQAEMNREVTKWRQVRSRSEELQLSLLRLAVNIEEQLTTADCTNVSDIHRIYLQAKALSDMKSLPALHPTKA